MPRPSKAVVLFDSTGSANTAFDTGVLDTSDFDGLLIEVLPSAAAGASTLSLYDTGLSASTATRAMATPATAAVKTSAWSEDASAAASGEYVGGLPGAVPAAVKVGIDALGVGVTARIRVVGRRSFKGVDGSYVDPITHGISHPEV